MQFYEALREHPLVSFFLSIGLAKQKMEAISFFFPQDEFVYRIVVAIHNDDFLEITSRVEKILANLQVFFYREFSTIQVVYSGKVLGKLVASFFDSVYILVSSFELTYPQGIWAGFRFPALNKNVNNAENQISSYRRVRKYTKRKSTSGVI
jgi:hypothetical protein